MAFTPFYMEPLKPGEEVTIEKIIITYVTEVFEIFVIFCIFKIILKKDITFYEIIKLSAFLGFIVMLIGLYDHDTKKSIKVGILSSVGSKLITL
jgi:hypothetical protein